MLDMSGAQTFQLTLEQDADYAFRVRFDDTTLADLMTDEPPPLGKGEGPNPSRMLVVAVANCLSASMLFAMRKFKNQPGKIVTKATAQLVRNDKGRMRVGHIDVVVRLAEAADVHTHLDRILATFEDYCVVTESVRHGVDVSVKVEDAQGNVLHGMAPAPGALA
jgi:organic hydroperoxide reductase OsmC/OhrA